VSTIDDIRNSGPVGDTGYVVVVQSRYEDATRVSSDLGKPAWLIGLLALSLVSLLALFNRWLSCPPR
jgi:hypothetical protein